MCDEVRRLDDVEIDAVRRDAPLVVPYFYSIENVLLGDGSHDKGSMSRARMTEIGQVPRPSLFSLSRLFICAFQVATTTNHGLSGTKDMHYILK